LNIAQEKSRIVSWSKFDRFEPANCNSGFLQRRFYLKSTIWPPSTFGGGRQRFNPTGTLIGR